MMIKKNKISKIMKIIFQSNLKNKTKNFFKLKKKFWTSKCKQKIKSKKKKETKNKKIKNNKKLKQKKTDNYTYQIYLKKK